MSIGLSTQGLRPCTPLATVTRARTPESVARILALGVVLLFACDSGERQDAQVVLSAIHRYRSASNDALPAMVDALRTTPCKYPETCQAKNDCLAVGDATAKALRLKNEVERGLAALEKGTLTKEAADEQVFPTKLDEAAALLKKGHEGLPRCDANVQALKRKHGI